MFFLRVETTNWSYIHVAPVFSLSVLEVIKDLRTKSGSQPWESVSRILTSFVWFQMVGEDVDGVMVMTPINGRINICNWGYNHPMN